MNKTALALVAMLMAFLPVVAKAGTTEDKDSDAYIKKVLFIGDSMTGWMAERLNAYGRANGFEVATVVWDGSTIRKWADSPRLSSLIRQQDPDAVFVSLGMNELLEKNPRTRLESSMTKLKKAFGDVPALWIGPPSWPGKPGGDALNEFIAEEMGEGHFSSVRNLTCNARVHAIRIRRVPESSNGLTRWRTGFLCTHISGSRALTTRELRK